MGKGLLNHSVTASDIKPPYRDFLVKPIPMDQITFDQISRSQVYVHFAGNITYEDFMGDSRETAFHYVWIVPETSPNSIRRLIADGWREVGGDKENYYT